MSSNGVENFRLSKASTWIARGSTPLKDAPRKMPTDEKERGRRRGRGSGFCMHNVQWASMTLSHKPPCSSVLTWPMAGPSPRKTPQDDGPRKER
ncbi:hypothetical protein L249_8487 [Ophiocordyceps polyrhachis-furcata BCC 54312]|uniref:Uncharacterized protein n=1 Tax=Ophiocordyceps polyrhachis-furcata BCC 54312 TaxID=1330021 RepID=A0A367L7U3_9HYPO|nr:hypothetical protein L249_8487 [Ophiocordyceps polyrhachis-furcata BCC 54312]